MIYIYASALILFLWFCLATVCIGVYIFGVMLFAGFRRILYGAA